MRIEDARNFLKHPVAIAISIVVIVLFIPLISLLINHIKTSSPDTPPATVVEGENSVATELDAVRQEGPNGQPESPAADKRQKVESADAADQLLEASDPMTAEMLVSIREQIQRRIVDGAKIEVNAETFFVRWIDPLSHDCELSSVPASDKSKYFCITFNGDSTDIVGYRSSDPSNRFTLSGSTEFERTKDFVNFSGGTDFKIVPEGIEVSPDVKFAQRVPTPILGALRVKSNIGEPFLAEILVSKLDLKKIHLAKVRMGTDREFHSMDLAFSAENEKIRTSLVDGGGVPVVRITSERPLINTSIDFYIELKFRSIRVIKQYSVFIDPDFLFNKNVVELSHSNPSVLGSYVVVGEFSNLADSQQHRSKLVEAGYRPIVESARDGRGNYNWVVLVGPFDTAIAANTEKDAIRARGLAVYLPQVVTFGNVNQNALHKPYSVASTKNDRASFGSEPKPEPKDIALERKKRDEERRQKQLAEQKKRDEEKKKRDEERRQKQLAEQKKRDEEKKKRDEERRQKQLAEQERERLIEELDRDLVAIAKRQQAELERRRTPTRASDVVEVARVISQIRDKVKREWAWVGDKTKLEVKYRLNLSSTGDILDLQKIGASGDSSFDVSVSQAIRLANPLPVPKDELLFREYFDPLVIRFSLEDFGR